MISDQSCFLPCTFRKCVFCSWTLTPSWTLRELENSTNYYFFKNKNVTGWFYFVLFFVLLLLFRFSVANFNFWIEGEKIEGNLLLQEGIHAVSSVNSQQNYSFLLHFYCVCEVILVLCCADPQQVKGQD